MSRTLLSFAICTWIARPVSADASASPPPSPQSAPTFDAVVEARATEPLHEPAIGIASISFEQAIEQALHAHPRDRVFTAEVKQYEARFASARAESLPTVDFRFEHIWEDSKIAPGGVRDPLDLYNVMLISAIPLVHARSWANWSEAKERLEVREAERLAERRQLALAAGHAWISAAAAAHTLAAEREGLRTASAHAEFVRARLSSGAAASLDLVRANKEVALASALVERARAGRRRAQERLGLMAGAEHALEADVSLASPLDAQPRVDAREVPEEAAARIALKAAQRETRNMFTDYLPSLHVELLGFHQNHPQPILPVTGTGYAAFLRLTVPLYQPEREAKLHERQAEELRAMAKLEDVSRIIAVERRDGETDVEHLGSALSETIRAAELAREALLLTESRYANGAGTQLDVIDALRESRELDIAVAAAEDALRRATLELLAARGQLPTPQQLDVHHH